MTIAILAEKNSAARSFAAALGGMKGSFNGENYVITAARGHLYELAQPENQPADPAAGAQLKSWQLPDMPWDESAFTWKRVPIKGTSDTIKQVRSVLSAATEIVIATDLDPTGEGDAIAWNIIDELRLHGKQFSRMEFTDEAPASIQKAFVKRRKITSMMSEGDYRKADFRNKFDFLTIQFTRVATASAAQTAVLRQGRLKSAIVKLVGDQLEAHNAYVKVPMFQNRFRDENGVLYTNPEEPRFATEAEVPQIYQPSKVVLDSRTNKSTAPRRLLDLAGLSSRLSSKGVKADQVLATYQKMYEAQIVSYPRTEDKTITNEQFNELLPFVNKIAAVVGVDTALLTHRAPRRTHVKDSGAHGANRPGPKVPPSLDELKKGFGPIAPLIYEELARSYLAMLAEDYVYESQEGHLESYPAFVGKASVPKSQGWKQVFSEADDKGSDSDADESENAAGLGQVGQPLVYEIIPPRPEHPSMKWLMKQLEKRDVGTGATRTSTYAEVTSEKGKYPLLLEKRGKITMTEFGDMSHRLLPGTRIGDLSITEQVYATMRRIADGTTTSEAELPIVAQWVRDDIDTMQRNAASMREELGLSTQTQTQQKEKYEGLWAVTGTVTKFNRVWSGHTFTEEECIDLLAGKEITIEAVSNAGDPYLAKGKLAAQTYKTGGKSYDYVGFKPDFGPKVDANGVAQPPASWCKHTFTPDEIDTLVKGGKVFCDDFVSKAGKTFGATVHFGTEAGSKDKKIIPEFG